MAVTRYKQARTLVRKLTRLPKESTDEFNGKVRKLREHFQQFNRDASQLCQWLMAVRPPEQQPQAPPAGTRTPPKRRFNLSEDTRAFWNFFMDPENVLPSTHEADGRNIEDRADKLRLAVMDHIVADAPLPELPADLVKSIAAVKQHPRTAHQSTIPIFARLRSIEPSHREVLLKAAAEWIIGRYKRPMDRWPDQHKHWQEERDKWFKDHPQLTEEVRAAFDELFRKIGAEDEPPDEPKPQDKKKQVAGLQNLKQLAVAVQPPDPYEVEQTRRVIRSRRPRICTLERMAGGLNNCEHNGERCGDIRHGPLCVKYLSGFEPHLKFRSDVAQAKDTGKAFGDAKRAFTRFAAIYLGMRAQGAAQVPAFAQVKESARASARRRASQGRDKKPLPPEQAARRIRAELEKLDGGWTFERDWLEYLNALGVTDDTAVRSFRDAGNQLPHCTDRKGTPNDKNQAECRFNPHTELCRKYKQAAADLPEKQRSQLMPLEKDYREWRASYKSAPRRPQFNYPSAKLLPMPKIFGAGYWKADFAKSRVTLTLETKEELTFGFEAWPTRSGKKPYSPQPPRDRVVSSFDKDIFTSVHVYFVGTRPRVGFRFQVEHKPGRIAVSQDEIDKLRSQQFPRAHQDKEFLREARKQVLDTFTGGAPSVEKELRVLAVDLGQVSAGYALFVGKEHKDKPQGTLAIAKVAGLQDHFPETTKQDGKKDHDYSLGLSKEHVVRHLDHAAEVASAIKAWRNKEFGENDPRAQVGDHDQRGRFRHVNRMVRDWVRLNVKQIIEKAEELNADLIVLDSSRKPMVPGRDDPDLPQKQRKAYRAFGQIRHKLREKAVERGMRVVTVPEAHTSEACHLCGQPGKQEKTERRFKCKNPDCEIHKAGGMHTDVNAALVLGRVFWGEIDPEQASQAAEARKAAQKDDKKNQQVRHGQKQVQREGGARKGGRHDRQRRH